MLQMHEVQCQQKAGRARPDQIGTTRRSLRTFKYVQANLQIQVFQVRQVQRQRQAAQG